MRLGASGFLFAPLLEQQLCPAERKVISRLPFGQQRSSEHRGELWNCGVALNGQLELLDRARQLSGFESQRATYEQPAAERFDHPRRGVEQSSGCRLISSHPKPVRRLEQGIQLQLPGRHHRTTLTEPETPSP